MPQHILSVTSVFHSKSFDGRRLACHLLLLLQSFITTDWVVKTPRLVFSSKGGSYRCNMEIIRSEKEKLFSHSNKNFGIYVI